MQEKPYRPFKISCGLREGYDLDSIVHSKDDARGIIQLWLAKRTKEGKKVAVGTLLPGEFIYPWVESGDISSRYEPAVNYAGIIRDDASDEDALEMLQDLAMHLSAGLRQMRVHVEFSGKYFLVSSELDS